MNFTTLFKLNFKWCLIENTNCKKKEKEKEKKM
jgi:hypothetical protein